MLYYFANAWILMIFKICNVFCKDTEMYLASLKILDFDQVIKEDLHQLIMAFFNFQMFFGTQWLVYHFL